MTGDETFREFVIRQWEPLSRTAAASRRRGWACPAGPAADAGELGARQPAADLRSRSPSGRGAVRV